MTNPQTNSTNEPVALLDVGRGNQPLRDEVLAAIAEVYDSGRFLFGPAVSELEQAVATSCNTTTAVGCASGSDALLLALMANDIGPGDEVIVPSFTFFATASCVTRVGAKLVFVDIDPQTYNMSPEAVAAAITPRTRAIIPVHLFGQSAAMDEITKLTEGKGISVIEDAAQAIGAAYHGRPVGSWGQCGCISFYPTKNLGGIGDGGMLATNSESFADRVRLCASHGMRPRYYHSIVGINSRLDTIQATALVIKMRHLTEYSKMRQDNARRYMEMFEAAGIVSDSADGIQLPYQDPAALHVWNQFSLRVGDGQRDALREHLSQQKIGSEIYYPIPLHQQECYADLGYATGSLPETERAAQEILHLPIYPELTEQEQSRVVAAVAAYYGANAISSAA